MAPDKIWQDECWVCKFEKMKAKHGETKARFRCGQECSKAIDFGRIERRKCFVEGCNGMGHVHHEDHRNLFEIIFVCNPHHGMITMAARYNMHAKVCQLIKARESKGRSLIKRCEIGQSKRLPPLYISLIRCSI